MAEKTPPEGLNDLCSDKGRTSNCPHFERSSCVIHFKCCEDGRFFPCHKCHNEAIEKENESALMKKRDNECTGDMNSAVTTEGVESTSLQASGDPNSDQANSTGDGTSPQTSTSPVDSESPTSSLAVPHLGTTNENQEPGVSGKAGQSVRQDHITAVNTTLERFEVLHPNANGKDGDRLKCAKCDHEQEFSQACEKCHCEFAEYFCLICKIFAKTSIGPYHCNKCDICRSGGRDNFSHCDTCNICMELKYYQDHICSENCGKDLCGICLEELFKGYVMLNCSHRLHRQCIEKLVLIGRLDCPLCRSPIFPDETEDKENTEARAATSPDNNWKSWKIWGALCFVKRFASRVLQEQGTHAGNMIV